MAALLILVISVIRLWMAPIYLQVADSPQTQVWTAPPLPGQISPQMLPPTGSLTLAHRASQTEQLPVPANTPTNTPVGGAQNADQAVVLLPTATMTPEPPPSAPQISLAPLQPAVTLSGFAHAWQTWNNCGPATLSMNLSYYGDTLNQADIGAVLRRFPDDKNVSPHELADYARSQGYMAQVRADGSTALAKTFLSNGVPILIETWIEPEPNDGMGHYRLLTGYDDARQRWTAYDSYVHELPVATGGEPYAGIYLDMAETERLWHVFNYTYVLVYTADQQALVETILGDAYDPTTMWAQTLARARLDVENRPEDPFAWFNLATNLVQNGDYTNAVQAFDRARAIGLPWRMLWYQFELFAAYHAMGRYEDIIQLADSTLAIAGGIEELHYWKGQALHGRNDMAGARQAWQHALQLNPDFSLAAAALNAVQ